MYRNLGSPELLECRRLLTTFTVNSLHSGYGLVTFTEAIQLANQQPGRDVIEFHVDAIDANSIRAAHHNITEDPAIDSWSGR